MDKKKKNKLDSENAVWQQNSTDILPSALSLQEALKCAEQYLKVCGIADASVDAWLLLEYVTGISRTRFLMDRGQLMQEDARTRYQELLQERGAHIPLQHLTGVQEFMGLEFLVNEHVLIPRQDTEILVEEAMKKLRPGMRVLDLCTGSGCIGISLAKLWPGGVWKCASESDRAVWRTAAASAGRPLAISVDGADISAEALQVAQRNAEKLGVPISLIQSDLFERRTSGKAACVHENAAIADREDTFQMCNAASEGKDRLGIYDMIVSNPPYIRTSVIEELSEEVRLHEPFGALDGREDGLYFYDRIIRESSAHLSENGWLLFEIGHDQGEAVSRLMSENGFEQVTVVQDLAGLDRVVYGRIKRKEEG